MVAVLVGVHGTAEYEHAPVRVERPRQRHSPGQAPLLEPVAARGDDVAEHSRPDLVAVDDCEDVHHDFADDTGTFSACKRRCSAFAFAAAWAMRPPFPSGLVALLLKKA